jgi:hypothetical protein
MSGLAGYARGGQGSGNVSKAQKARGTVEKAGKPFPEAATPFGEEGEEGATTPNEPTTKSLAVHARAGIVLKQIAPDKQPSVPSNIPGSDSQGVPGAERDEMGALARSGNVDQAPKVVAAQTGLGSHGPAIRSSLARMGGQIGLSPGQFGAWAHPMDPTEAPLRSPSSQVTSNASKPGSGPEPAPPVY